jgi:hypothetical protein
VSNGPAMAKTLLIFNTRLPSLATKLGLLTRQYLQVKSLVIRNKRN